MRKKILYCNFICICELFVVTLSNLIIEFVITIFCLEDNELIELQIEIYLYRLDWPQSLMSNL